MARQDVVHFFLMHRRHGSTTSKPRKEFVLKSLVIFLVFVALTIIQLHLTKQSENVATFFKDHLILSVIFFSLAMFHILLFVFVENLRLIKTLNWLFGFFIVECLVLAITVTMLSFSYWQLFTSIVISSALVMLFYIIATFITHDLTLDVIILFVLSYIFLISLVYFLTLFAITKAEFTINISMAIITMVVCMFIMYHAQCIMGGRYAEIRSSDYILAALIVYVDFLLLLMISLNITQQIVNVTHKALK